MDITTHKNFIYIVPMTINISFNESVYCINEPDGPVQPILVLSNSLSSDITVQVLNIDLTATGKYMNNLIMYNI